MTTPSVKSISEPIPIVIICYLGPPAIFLVQCVVTGGIACFAFFTSTPWIIKGIALLLLCIFGAMAGVWERTFFNKISVGIGAPFRIEWTADRIWFRGAYFGFDVPVASILGHRVIGFRRFESMFTLYVKVKSPDGRVLYLPLSTTMRKKRELLHSLEAIRKEG